MAEGGRRAELLRKVIELLLHQCSSMLPVYVENVLSFVNDKSTEVRKQVISFIEDLRSVNMVMLLFFFCWSFVLIGYYVLFYLLY